MAGKTRSRMKATLVRFGPDLYADLQEEAARSGVSVAQYVREAVVARMAYDAGRRGDKYYGEAALQAAGHLRHDAERLREENAAVRAQTAQARAHSTELRAKRRGAK